MSLTSTLIGLCGYLADLCYLLLHFVFQGTFHFCQPLLQPGSMFILLRLSTDCICMSLHRGPLHKICFKPSSLFEQLTEHIQALQLWL